jgi:hypothetical protein
MGRLRLTEMLMHFFLHQGGHFAALEQPELLMEDIKQFVEQVWQK